MDTAPLTLFAQKVSASNRLLFADLRRLRRDILPNGITTREEAEVLLELDGLERLDAEWPAYLAEAMAAFILSASEPPDLDPATMAWLVAVLTAAQPRTAAAVVRTLERDGYQLSEELAALTRRAGRRLAAPGRIGGGLIARPTVVLYLERNEQHPPPPGSEHHGDTTEARRRAE